MIVWVRKAKVGGNGGSCGGSGRLCGMPLACAVVFRRCKTVPEDGTLQGDRFILLFCTNKCLGSAKPTLSFFNNTNKYFNVHYHLYY